MRPLTVLTSAALMSLSLATAAQAGIKCNEDYQVVAGSEISTPYCRDNFLAQVARSYGIRVTNAEVRNNPGRKGEVCRMIGHDIRAQPACAGYEGRRGRP